MSQLSFSSEKCITKLIDNEVFKCYKDRLSDTEVFKFFEAIAKQAKKVVAKNAELKALVDDWEAKIIALHSAQDDDSRVAARAQNRKGDASKIDASEFAIQEEAREVEIPVVQPTKSKKSTKVVKKKKAKKIEVSDDEVESMDEDDIENVAPVSKSVKSVPVQARSSRARNKA